MDMTDKKMSGKASKEGAVELSALLQFADKANDVPEEPSEAPKIDPKPQKAANPAPPVKSAPKAAEKPSEPPKKRKKEEEHLTEKVNFRVSKTEYEKLKAEAGLVNVSVIVRKALKDQGLI